jgi:hypothetical protein
MLPLTLPSARFRPLRYRADGVGMWSGHIPFACDLVAGLRPSVFVELGTHYGESYFAFCQAIEAFGMPCSAFAVDTWQGDAHTGHYGEDVFEDVNAYNRAHYASFSTLLRTTFDQAAEQFAPESIGILHIDGLHSYEAVRHDFGTWFPKVQPGGAVLLHDTEVQRPNFGVRRFWAELQQQHCCFGFKHSSGLGVVFKPGLSSNMGIVSILSGDSGCQDAVREYYELCADRLELQSERRDNELGEHRVFMQIFWRFCDGGFSERQSTKRVATINGKESAVVLSIPPLEQTPTQFRIDLADRPVQLLVRQISFLDAEGEKLGDVDLQTSSEYLMSGMRIVSTEAGALVDVEGADPSMLLPEGGELLDRLRGGGSVRVLMAAPGTSEWVRLLLDHFSSKVP